MLTKDEIKILVDEYPFLWPTLIENGKFKGKVYPYDYSYCEISYLPEGWIRSFIPNFLKELKQILINHDIFNSYFIYKVGVNCFKLEWIGSIQLPEILDLITKYNKLIKNYCYDCGNIPSYRSTWGFVVCNDCAHRRYNWELKRFPDEKFNWNDEYELL